MNALIGRGSKVHATLRDEGTHAICAKETNRGGYVQTTVSRKTSEPVDCLRCIKIRAAQVAAAEIEAYAVAADIAAMRSSLRFDMEVRTEATEVIAAAVEQHEAAARQHEQAAADSFDRCDTDGSVSQWASQTLAREERLAADIARDGGKAEFPALFDLDGNLVAAKLVTLENRFRGFGTVTKWAILGSDDPTSRATEWVTAFPVRAATMARKGYYEGTVRATAKADLVGSGTGLAAAHTVRAVAVRTDGGFSRDVEIVDNGHAPVEGAPVVPDAEIVAQAPAESDDTVHEISYVGAGDVECLDTVTGLKARDARMCEIIANPSMTLIGCKRVDADRFTLMEAQIEANAAENETLNLAAAEHARNERDAEDSGNHVAVVAGLFRIDIYRNMQAYEAKREPLSTYGTYEAPSDWTATLNNNGWRLLSGWQTHTTAARWVEVEPRDEVTEYGSIDKAAILAKPIGSLMNSGVVEDAADRKPRRMERNRRNTIIAMGERKPEDDAAVGEWLDLLTSAPDDVLRTEAAQEAVRMYRRGEVRRAVEALKGLIVAASMDSGKRHAQDRMWSKTIDDHLALCWRRNIPGLTREEAATRLVTFAHHDALHEHFMAKECTHGGDCRVHPDASGLHNHDADARIDTGERTSETCAYPNDTDGAHDHADCLDALATHREDERARIVRERNADAVAPGERKPFPGMTWVE